MPRSNEIQSKSEALQEVLGRAPNWMMRWGITVIFALLLSILTGSWFISYPDIVEGNVTVLSTSPSISVVSPTSGKIKKLYKADKSEVVKGEILAELERPFSAEQLNYLNLILDQLKELETVQKMPDFQDNLDLGSLNEAHINLMAAVEQWLQWETEQYSDHQVKQLEYQLGQQLRLNEIIKREVEIGELDLANATQVYEVNRALYEQGTISKLEFLSEESLYRSKQSAFEKTKKQRIQSELIINDLRKKLYDLQYTLKSQKRELLQSVSLYENQISMEIDFWKRENALIAPTSGILHYASVLNENQFINAGELIFQVVPISDSLYAIADVQTAGFGKVHVNQKAFIRLSNYPYQEFGQIEAEVVETSPFAIAGNYQVKLALPHQLMSTHQRQLSYQSDLAGQLRIITNDRSLLQRIFQQLDRLAQR